VLVSHCGLIVSCWNAFRKTTAQNNKLVGVAEGVGIRIKCQLCWHHELKFEEEKDGADQSQSRRDQLRDWQKQAAGRPVPEIRKWNVSGANGLGLSDLIGIIVCGTSSLIRRFLDAYAHEWRADRLGNCLILYQLLQLQALFSREALTDLYFYISRKSPWMLKSCSLQCKQNIVVILTNCVFFAHFLLIPCMKIFAFATDYFWEIIVEYIRSKFLSY